jgi:hypothetical protein
VQEGWIREIGVAAMRCWSAPGYTRRKGHRPGHGVCAVAKFPNPGGLRVGCHRQTATFKDDRQSQGVSTGRTDWLCKVTLTSNKMCQHNYLRDLAQKRTKERSSSRAIAAKAHGSLKRQKLSQNLEGGTKAQRFAACAGWGEYRQHFRQAILAAPCVADESQRSWHP